jgi:hypothetical protein
MIKTILTIKFFLVLCCQTSTNSGQYVYEVYELPNKQKTGIIYSSVQYKQGDTIKISVPAIEITANK